MQDWLNTLIRTCRCWCKQRRLLRSIQQTAFELPVPRGGWLYRDTLVTIVFQVSHIHSYTPLRSPHPISTTSISWHAHRAIGTPTKRQVKMSGFKTSGFRTSGFKTSGLQNVRFTKRQVSKRLVSKRPVFKFDILIYLLNKKYRNCQVCIPI